MYAQVHGPPLRCAGFENATMNTSLQLGLSSSLDPPLHSFHYASNRSKFSVGVRHDSREREHSGPLSSSQHAGNRGVLKFPTSQFTTSCPCTRNARLNHHFLVRNAQFQVAFPRTGSSIPPGSYLSLWVSPQSRRVLSIDLM